MVRVVDRGGEAQKASADHLHGMIGGQDKKVELEFAYLRHGVEGVVMSFVLYLFVSKGVLIFFAVSTFLRQ